MCVCVIVVVVLAAFSHQFREMSVATTISARFERERSNVGNDPTDIFVGYASRRWITVVDNEKSAALDTTETATVAALIAAVFFIASD